MQVPEEIKQWKRVEAIIWELASQISEEDAKIIKEFDQELIYSLFCEVFKWRKFSALMLSDSYFKVYDKKYQLSESGFAFYIFSKGNIEKNCFSFDISKKTADISKIEKPFADNSIEFAILHDDMSLISNLISNNDITKEKICLFDNESLSYIDFAAFCGSRESFVYFLLNGCEITKGDDFSTVAYAVEGGNERIIELIESKGFDFNHQFVNAVVYHRNSVAIWLYENYSCGYVGISYYIDHWNTELFLYMLENGQSITQKDWGKTALMSAVANNNIPLAKFCIENGVSIRAKDRDRKDVREYAKTELMKRFLSSYI